MPISLRIPPEKEAVLREAAEKAGKTKTSIILEAVDEKLQPRQTREERIRAASGWLSAQEASQLRTDMGVFDVVDEGDWK